MRFVAILPFMALTVAACASRTVVVTERPAARAGPANTAVTLGVPPGSEKAAHSNIGR